MNMKKNPWLDGHLCRVSRRVSTRRMTTPAKEGGKDRLCATVGALDVLWTTHVSRRGQAIMAS